MTDAPRPGRVVVIGDVIDDVLVYPLGPIRRETDTPSRIGERPGGSAANTAAWLGHLGIEVDFYGRVGRADAARHAAELARVGVRAHLSQDPDLPTGRIVVLVEGDQRTFLTMRGANAALSLDVLTDEVLEGAAAVHVTGHTLVGAGQLDRMPALIDRAHRAGARVSLDPSSAGFIIDLGPDRLLAAVQGVDALLPSLDEAVALTGMPDPADAATAALGAVTAVVVTLGARGALVAEHGSAPVTVPAVAVEVVDPTGAGDAFAAGFVAAWLEVADARAASHAGSIVAARAVGRLGGRPDVGVSESNGQGAYALQPGQAEDTGSENADDGYPPEDRPKPAPATSHDVPSFGLSLCPHPPVRPASRDA